MPVGIQNAAATSKKRKDPGLHKGNTGSQTLDYGLLPKGVDSYAIVSPIRVKHKSPNHELKNREEIWITQESQFWM